MKRSKVVYLGLAVLLALTTLLAGFSCGPAEQEEVPILVGGPPTMWSTYPIAVATSDLVSRNSNLNLTVRGYDAAAAKHSFSIWFLSPLRET